MLPVRRSGEGERCFEERKGLRSAGAERGGAEAGPRRSAGTEQGRVRRAPRIFMACSGAHRTDAAPGDARAAQRPANGGLRRTAV